MSASANVVTMPVIAPKKRVARSRCAHLEAEQLEAFMTAAKAHGSREWAMFVFAFSHGARVSEICDLRWSDVNFPYEAGHRRSQEALPGADAGVPEG
jgi:integrase